MTTYDCTEILKLQDEYMAAEVALADCRTRLHDALARLATYKVGDIVTDGSHKYQISEVRVTPYQFGGSRCFDAIFVNYHGYKYKADGTLGVRRTFLGRTSGTQKLTP